MELERARDELKTYGVLKQSLEKLENDARFAELAAMSPRISDVSPVPLHGGGNRYEEKLAAMIDKKDEYSDAARLCLTVEITLDIMYPGEKSLLIMWYLHKMTAEQIGRRLHVSAPRVYQLRDKALEKYAYCRDLVEQTKQYGIVKL